MYRKNIPKKPTKSLSLEEAKSNQTYFKVLFYVFLKVDLKVFRLFTKVCKSVKLVPLEYLGTCSLKSHEIFKSLNDHFQHFGQQKLTFTTNL